MELWTGVIGNRTLDAHEQETRKNREAESAHVRRELWGASEDMEEDMGNTMLGDINHPTPIIVPPQQSSMLPAIALAAIAGVGGYLVADKTQQKEPETPSYKDGTVDVGLGKITDYMAE